MPITLSDVDLLRVQAAMRDLLSPLSHSSASDWAAKVLDSCAALLQADQCAMGLPNAGVLETQAYGPYMAAAAGAYGEYYWRYDYAVTERPKRMGLEVYHRDMVYTAEEKQRSVVINEWGNSNKLADPLLMSFQLEEERLPAMLAFYHDSDDGPLFGSRGIIILNLLVPAFKAGVHTIRQLHHRRAELARLVDALPAGLEIRDLGGRLLHRSAALLQLLRQQPDAGRLEQAIGRAAETTAHLCRGTSREACRTLADTRLSEEVIIGGGR